MSSESTLPASRTSPAPAMPRPAVLASWLLRLALLGHAAALFAIVFETRQTQFGNFLFLELFDPRVGEEIFGFQIADPYMAAVWIERLTVSLYFLLGLAVVLQPLRNHWLLYALLAAAAAGLTYRFPVFPAWEVAGHEVSLVFLIGLVVLAVMLWLPMLLVLPIMFAYVVMESLCGTWYGGYRFHEWTIYSDALRWGAPLVLVLLIGLRWSRWGEWLRLAAARDLLRVLIAVVFLMHGLQAWLANPGFIDLILGTVGRTFDAALASVGIAEGTSIGVSEPTAVAIMKVIAIVDFLVALAVVLLPRPVLVPQRFWAPPSPEGKLRRLAVPALVLWLAFWGLVTAASRMTGPGLPVGLSQYPELLIRASHYLGPLAAWGLMLATYWPRALREPSPGAAAPEREPAPIAADPAAALTGADPARAAESLTRTT